MIKTFTHFLISGSPLNRLRQFVLVFALTVIIPGTAFGQTLNVTVSPSAHCYDDGLNTGMAYVTIPEPGATSYSWTIFNPPGVGNSSSFNSFPGGQINYIHNGCGVYTLVCTAYNGATALTQDTAYVTVDCFHVVPPTQTVCIGTTVTLTAVGANSYTWSTGATGPSITPTPLASGFYTVISNSNPSCISAGWIDVLNPSISISSASTCLGSTVALTASGVAIAGYTWSGTGISSPISQASVAVGPGTYTVSSQASNSVCTATTSIAALPPLSINVSQSGFTTCIASNTPKLSNSITLTAGGANSYIWNPPPSSTVPANGATVAATRSVTTCYTVTGIMASCQASAVACVTVIPQFTVSLTQHKVTICRFDSLIAKVSSIGAGAVGPSSAYSYSWKFSSTPTSVSGALSPTVVFYPMLTTAYTVEVTDALNCISAPATSTVFVASCPPPTNSIAELTGTEGLFSFYPNPAKNILFIEAKTSVPPDLIIEAWDITGRLVISKRPQYLSNENRYLLGLEELKPGLYTYILRSQQKLIQTGKFIKTD